MDKIKKTEEEELYELIDMDGSYIEGDFKPSDSLTVTNRPDRNGVAPPTSATYARQAVQDPSWLLIGFGGMSAVIESEIKENILQDRTEERASVVNNKNVDILSDKEIENMYNETYLVKDAKAFIKNIDELWTKFSEQEKDLNQLKMSLLYMVLKETNVQKMPEEYKKQLKKLL